MIPKNALAERLSGGPRSDEAKRILDRAYELADMAAQDAREFGKGKFKAEYLQNYKDEMANMASQVASMKTQVEAGRSSWNKSITPELQTLHNNAGLADGALMNLRHKLAQAAGLNPQSV